MQIHANNFHFIRFVAAILVIYGHSYPLLGLGNLDLLQKWSQGTFPTAHIGVCIFFSISGYLIAQSLERSHGTFNFIWRRALRIVPGLLGVILFTMFILGPIVTSVSLETYFGSRETWTYFKILKLIPPTAGLLPGVFETLPTQQINGSLWTLSYEVFCYAVILGVFVGFVNKSKYAILLLFLSIWLSFFFWHDPLLQNQGPIRWIRLNWFDIFNFSLYFLCGSIIHFFKIKLDKRVAILLFVIFIILYILSAIVGILPLSSLVWFRYLMVPYIVLYFANLKTWINGFEKAGDLSYGLYIYAFPIQQFFVWHFGVNNISPIGLFFMSLAVTLPLAWISWHLIEEPALKLKNAIR